MKKNNPNLKGTTLLIFLASMQASVSQATEAPAGFDGLTNGFILQGDYDNDKELFKERRTIANGLGPVFNAESCAECHANPTTGGSSQVSALRAGIFNGKKFIEPPGGSVIHDRATDASLQSTVSDEWNVRAVRLSSNTLGGGFVEAIADETLREIAKHQNEQSNGEIHGQVVMVDVVEVPGAKRVGRFGWKSQHASLLSFNAEAFRSEMGITNALFPTENTANGRSVAEFDTMADPENNGWGVALLTEFVRATKAPPRDSDLAVTEEALSGEHLFEDIGCGLCHTATITTAPIDTVINAGTFKVPSALGDKTIHPFSDFLLHDIGTGDGIVQNGGQSTRNKLRTAPLWGLRTRSRLLHDGSALTPLQAINRHQGESATVTKQFKALSAMEKSQLLKFLESL
ncbi:MAG: di-heme oxidoredictase family protein [Methylovulum sp.]|nr:di-heme oxidoredictase family protein [Methylovulum sp.]